MNKILYLERVREREEIERREIEPEMNIQILGLLFTITYWHIEAPTFLKMEFQSDRQLCCIKWPAY